jgi:hypothetical protein
VKGDDVEILGHLSWSKDRKTEQFAMEVIADEVRMEQAPVEDAGPGQAVEEDDGFPF